MKNGLSLGCILSILSSVACAGSMGDIQTTDEWTGLYVGGNLGGIWSNFNGPVTIASYSDDVGTYPASPMPFNANQSSVMGGGQVGYHWKINQALIGTEINVDGMSLSNSRVVTANQANSNTYNAGGAYVAGDSFKDIINWQGAWVGHLGFVTDHWLLYALGGVTFIQAQITANITQSTYEGVLYPGTSGSSSSVLVGGTVGGGIEYAFTEHAHLGVEYRYAGYGSHKYYAGQMAASQSNAGTFIYAPIVANMNLSTNQVLVRVNYKF